jgi:arabinofuranan 3-O-arabinosyltransferase
LVSSARASTSVNGKTTKRRYNAAMSIEQGLISRRDPAVSGPAEKIVFVVAAGIGVGYAASYALMYAMHVFMFDPAGHPVLTDFLQFWSAGHLALHGNALAAYDPRLIHAAEAVTVGHPIKADIGWFYPPTFFFVAALLACIPSTMAFILWTNLTLLFQGAIAAAITKRWAALFVTAFPPWVMLCTLEGQDGLLNAGLIGAVLLTLERQPVLSGILLGLLSYKPQFGLLFPIALAFGGYWRSFAWAAATVAALAVTSGLVLGFAAWPDFFHALARAAETHLTTNTLGVWPGMLSMYGLARCLGLSYHVAMLLQALLSAFCAAAVALLLRSRAPYDLKAAALAVALPLVTPYVWVYDLPVLTIALSYLYRNARFDAAEWCGVAVALISVAAFPVHVLSAFPGGNLPSGLLAGGAVGALVCRRLWREKLRNDATLRPRIVLRATGAIEQQARAAMP